MFGQLGFGSDGNRLSTQAMLGLAGSSPIEGRENDRWGVARSSFFWADELSETSLINSGVNINDEWAVEAFYKAEINEIIRVGANVMYVRPTLGNFDDLVQVGIRVRATY
mgnify:FL=1